MQIILYICGMTRRLSLSNEEAIAILGYHNSTGRYRFSDLKKWKEVLNKREEMRNKGRSQVTSQMSALKSCGTLMDIDEYCEHYGIPRNNVRSYKLVSHTATPYYNIQSTNIIESSDIDVIDKINSLISKYKRKPIKRKKVSSKTSIAQLVFSDVHIGMDNKDGLYGGNWSESSLFERRKAMAESFVNKIKDADCVQVINLGDYADGLDGKTVRRQHDLPQNMSNEQVFDAGVKFMLDTFEDIYHNIKCNRFVWYNVCNSNHSSSFDYFIAQAFKAVITAKYPTVDVINERRFIGHIKHGDRVDIITHGKDDINLRFGFKPALDDKGEKKIEEYIKHHRLHDYKIAFHKGDSHLRVIDKTSPYFTYNSYLAFSPSSSWVQTNFQAGRSGFTINVIDQSAYSIDYEFQWNSNKLQ